MDEEYKPKCCNRRSSGCLFQWINIKVRCLFPVVYIFDAEIHPIYFRENTHEQVSFVVRN
jgi:hypothetical protein